MFLLSLRFYLPRRRRIIVALIDNNAASLGAVVKGNRGSLQDASGVHGKPHLSSVAVARADFLSIPRPESELRMDSLHQVSVPLGRRL